MGQPETKSTSFSTSSSLIVRVRQGDDLAWRRLVQLYGPLVNYWLGRTDLQAGDIDDIFQDVFLSVAYGIEAFKNDRPEHTFRGWLRTITRAKVADYFRRNQKHLPALGGSDAYQLIQQIPQSDEVEDPGEELVLHQIRLQALEAVKAEFEERTWQMFWQVTIGGRSTRHVAEELGVTPSAVRLAKSRVLRRLREELGDEDGGGL